MKLRLLPILAASFLLPLAALAEAALLKLVPAGTEFCLSADLSRLPSNLKPGTGEGQLLAERVKLLEARSGLKAEECSRLLWVSGGRSIRGLLLKTTVTPEEHRKRIGSAEGFSERMVEGKKVFTLSGDVPDSPMALCHLEPGVLLVTEECYLVPFLNGMGKGTCKAATPAGNPPAWCFFDSSAAFGKDKKKKVDPAALVFGGTKQIVGRFDPQTGEAWKLAAVADCRDDASAAMFQQMVGTYLMMGSAFIFMNEPQLGSDLMKTVKFRKDGNQVHAELNVDEALAARLAEFLKSEAERRVIPGDPVPDDLRGRTTAR